MTDMMDVVTPSQLESELRANIQCQQAVMVWGPPGVGKSEIVQGVAKKLDRALIDLRANLLEPVDLRGIPHIEEGLTKWAVPDFLPNIKVHGETGILNIEELPTAMPSTQTAMYQLILDGRLGDYVLPGRHGKPGRWDIIATGNRQQDRASTYQMPTPLKNRFAHYNLGVSVKDWLDWAARNKVDFSIMGYIRWKEASLHMFDADAEAFPTPRTWVKLSNRLPFTDRSNLFMAASSLVGKGAGGEYTAFVKICDGLPDIDELIKNPAKASVPKEPSILHAICSKLASVATVKNFAAILKYVKRIDPEFGVIVVSDAIRRCDELVSNEAFIEWTTQNSDVVI